MVTALQPNRWNASTLSCRCIISEVNVMVGTMPPESEAITAVLWFYDEMELCCVFVVFWA